MAQPDTARNAHPEKAIGKTTDRPNHPSAPQMEVLDAWNSGNTGFKDNKAKPCSPLGHAEITSKAITFHPPESGTASGSAAATKAGEKNGQATTTANGIEVKNLANYSSGNGHKGSNALAGNDACSIQSNNRKADSAYKGAFDEQTDRGRYIIPDNGLGHHDKGNFAAHSTPNNGISHHDKENFKARRDSADYFPPYSQK